MLCWSALPGWTPGMKAVVPDRGVALSPPVKFWFDGYMKMEPSPEAAAAISLQSTGSEAVAVCEDPVASKGVDELINELVIKERVGEGTQSEVLLGELPGRAEPVAVKLGLKKGALAREAAALAAVAGTPGFPVMLHHEPEGALAAGGFLVMDLLGPSLDDLLKSQVYIYTYTTIHIYIYTYTTICSRARWTAP